MENRLAAYKGCLLGLAVGDAMGYGVDHMTWEQIREQYGAGGLRGYELLNGYAQTTSYTQTAAYACNGLLLGMTHGQLRGSMLPPVRYIALALREWAGIQGYSREPNTRNHCWISTAESMRLRRCMDTAMVDQLNQNRLGTMEEHHNRNTGAGALTTAAAVGLFFDPRCLKRREIQRLGAETVALTHGGPGAFLSGAALAHIISRIVWDGVTDLRALTRETISMLKKRFGGEYAQTAEVCQHLQTALILAKAPKVSRIQAMEQMGCVSASRVLAGALYVCMCHGTDFDECMAAAVNHSGASCAVGAVAGAILGAVLGAEKIPAKDLEPMEAAPTLRELAADLFQGCPMGIGGGLFDMEWDDKYVTGGV